MTNLDNMTGEDPIKGGTSTKVDKTPLFEANNTYLREKKDMYNRRLTEFVTDAFTASQSLPKIGGKPVKSLDEIPTLIDRYGNELYEQAKRVKDNPDISDDQAKILLTRQKKVDDAFGYIAKANSIMYEDMMNAAKTMDAKMKVQGWHTLLLNEKGQFKGAAEAKKDIDAYRAKMIDQEMKAWQKANPFPEASSMYWQRTDMPNPMGNRMVKGADGKLVRLDPRPKLIDSKEGQMMAYGMQYELVSKKYKDLNYDHVLRRLREEYDKNSKTRRIRAAEENVFRDNAGGAKTAVGKQEFRFDVDNFADDDGQGGMKVKPEMEYAVDVFKNIINNPNVFMVQGQGDGSIKKSVDVPAKSMLKAFYEDLQSTLYNVERRKGSDKRPAGTISFTPMAGGDENFHAYHIKLPASYFDKYQGSENNPGIARGQKEMINNGITVYVPVAESAKMKIGQQSLKGTKISPVEGMISLSGNNSFTRTIDDGLEYTISLDQKSGQYVVTGNAVAYNPRTAKMDTLPINELGIKSRWDLTVDLDQLDKDLFKIGLKNFQMNRERKREHSRLTGVRDPKKLSGN